MAAACVCPILMKMRPFASLSYSGIVRSAQNLATVGTADDDVVAKVDSRTDSPDLGRLFAVVHVSGVQRKVTAQDIITVTNPVVANIGERIVLNKVLLAGGRDFTLVGRPVLGPDIVRVEATVLEKTLSHGRVCFWYHRRQNHKKLYLRKENLTMLLINSVELKQIPGNKATIPSVG